MFQLYYINFCASFIMLRSSSSLSMSEPVILRVLASSVKIADRAGQIVRDIMAGGQLGKRYYF